jgi:hypothetical protein
MPLQLGTWHINVNGTEGNLDLQAIDTQGAVTGALFGTPLRGLWDEVSQSITFAVQGVIPPGVPPPPAPLIPHAYRGYLFCTPPSPPPGKDVLWTLAGLVVDSVGQTANGISGTSRRNEFGWFAQCTQVV